MKILLIHGLSRTSLSLLRLEWSLKKEGWATEQFNYLAVTETFDQIVDRLRVRLQVLASQSQGAYGIVAHSLGGLLVRVALGSGCLVMPRHIVMLGTPNQLPRLALHAWKIPPFRWWTGQCGLNLTQAEFFTSLPKLESSYTIVAGTAGWRGLLSPFGDELNDGIVAVKETKIDDRDRLIQLPVLHTFMMNDSIVQQTVTQAFINLV